MDFGKVREAGNVDFTLPPDDDATGGILARTQSAMTAEAPHGNARTQVFVGLPVWQDDAMARRLCPQGTSKAARLACYARQFPALELNSTGYGMDAARVRHWAGEVPAGFRFCPKVPMDMSHGRDLDLIWDQYAQHCEVIAGFADRLGLPFLQFPNGFAPDRFAELERFIKSQAARLPLALEVRHPLWFADAVWKRKLFALLEAHGIAAVITDTPGRRDVLHQRLTTPTAFIRFNGHPLGRRDLQRLDAWAARVREWLEQGLQTLYFFVHLENMDDAVDLAAHFIAALNRICGLKLSEPKLQIEVENLSLFP